MIRSQIKLRALFSSSLLTALAIGCDPGQQNEGEFLDSTEPGKPPAVQDASYTSRRERLHQEGEQTRAEAKAAKSKKGSRPSK